MTVAKAKIITALDYFASRERISCETSSYWSW